MSLLKKFRDLNVNIQSLDIAFTKGRSMDDTAEADNSVLLVDFHFTLGGLSRG